ncbi:MAG TPA: response regulator [Thermoanaerobaculia bacterium]|jgi:CheY-like chemotaxis protein
MAKRILLADDSITIQKVVELTFSDGDYEVTAVNNGNKAVQKLSEMRPDIILSDIIMPEKNGYEVCEYVKSHPEYRSIPVILLTGTFEPFDPDRADKAGCDAVVTKPFESQSLIHKVEELIEAAKSQAPTAQTPAVTTPTTGPTESPFAAAPPQPKVSETFATGTFPTSGEVFASSGSSSKPTTEIPLDEPPTTGETRAFPKMSFDDMPPPPPTTGAGETRAFPKLTFEDMPKPASPPPPPPPSGSPWDEPAPTGGGETKAFPKMSFDDFQKSEPAPMTPPPSPTPETPPWDSRPSGNFEASEPSESAAWDEQPVGETKAFPKMSFEDLDKTPAKPAAKPAAEEPMFTPPPPPPPAPSPLSSSSSGELSDEQIDKIARRVVQLLSDQVVRNIAWEVIPDLAETVVKERIRQLESE